jgi:ABC-type nitrate/sulfonate/bicarbonate transport system permease component
LAAPAVAATAEPRARAARRRPLSVGAIRLVTILVAVAIWELLARSGWFYQDVIPSIWKIAYALFEELISAGFWADLGVTLEEHIVGFTAGSALAIAAGIVLGANSFVRRAVSPYLNALGSTPKIVFLPILFLLFGTGIQSKMANGALSAFFPVIFATMLGMVLVNPVHLRVGRSFNISRRQLITKIYIPSMIGPLMIGLKLGMAIAVTGVLVAEIRAANAGIGFRLSNYYDSFQIAPLYALIIVCFSLAAFAHIGMSAVQRRFTRHEGLDAETTERLQSQR